MPVVVEKELSDFQRELLGVVVPGGEPLDVHVYEANGEEPITIKVRSAEGEVTKYGVEQLAVADVFDRTRLISHIGKGHRGILPPGDFSYFYDRPRGQYRNPLRIIIREQIEGEVG